MHRARLSIADSLGAQVRRLSPWARFTPRQTLVRCSSTASQARASRQSRMTVCGETPSASREMAALGDNSGFDAARQGRSHTEGSGRR